MASAQQAILFSGYGSTSAGDASFASVNLLAGFEGADAATSYTEESSSARVASFVGNAQLDTAQFKFGTSSALFDGTTDRITFPASNTSWVLSPSANSDQFTVESFFRPNASQTSRIFTSLSGGTVGNLLCWRLGISSGGQLFFDYSTAGSSYDVATVGSGTTFSTGTWYHVACDKDSGGKIRLYVDGTMVGSATPANSVFHAPATPPVLGIGSDVSNALCINGWLDEVRITKGVARYANDGGFTAPIVAFPRS